MDDSLSAQAIEAQESKFLRGLVDVHLRYANAFLEHIGATEEVTGLEALAALAGVEDALGLARKYHRTAVTLDALLRLGSPLPSMIGTMMYDLGIAYAKIEILQEAASAADAKTGRADVPTLAREVYTDLETVLSNVRRGRERHGQIKRLSGSRDQEGMSQSLLN